MGLVKSKLCDELQSKFDKQLSTLNKAKLEIANAKAGMLSKLQGYLPSGIDIPTTTDAYELKDFARRCAAMSLDEGKGFLSDFDPFEFIDFPEADISDAINFINDKFDSLEMPDSINTLNSILNCLDLRCGVNVTDMVNAMESLMDEIDVTEDGILDSGKIFEDSGVTGPNLNALDSKMKEADKYKSKVKDLIKGF